MKVLYTFILSLILTFTLTTCNSDVDNNREEGTILAVWLSTSQTQETFINNTSTNLSNRLINEDNFIELSLRNDLTFIEKISSCSEICDTPAIESNTGTYTLSDSQIVLTARPNTITEQITSYTFILDTNELILTETDETNSNGDTNIKTEVITTYTRILN